MPCGTKMRVTQIELHAMKGIFSIALLLVSTASSWAAAPDDVARQRERFMDAYEAGLRGQTARAESIAANLRDYVLAPYLDYAILKGRLDDADADDVRAFIDGHDDTPLAWRMRVEWLHELAGRKDWRTFRDWYTPTSDTTLRCHHATARLRTGATEGLAAEVTDLWLVGRSQPDACDPVFDWLYGSGRVTQDLRYERVVRALESGNVSLARWLADKLPSERRVWYLRWRQMIVAPERTLETAKQWQDLPESRRIVLYGLRRLGRTDEGEKAWQAFNAVAGDFEFTPEERGVLLRQLALDAATDYHPDAERHLDAVPDDFVNDSARQWRVRVALQRRDWPAVLEAMSRLTPAEREEERWRYWRARALDATGDGAAARALYTALAGETSYYGFLAADRIDAPYRFSGNELSVPPERLDGVAARPAMARALELFQVGLHLSARREWQLALEDADRETLRAAALLAARAGWHDRAILALADTADWQAYTLRFPLAHEQLVESSARRHGLDVAWLYGLIRAESSFGVDARSPAGALGLMQVMPDTGRRVARDLGAGWRGNDDLLAVERNLALGSAYLAQLFKRYQGNMVLATAAYNAGPRNVDKWIEENDPDDPAIWAETIPFYETRAYIQRVMAFSAVYDWRLGREVLRLGDRMPAHPPTLARADE